MKRSGLMAVMVSTTSSLLPAQASLAQASSTGASSPATEAHAQLGEIVVTATRQSTNIQSVPLSITAVSGADLKARNVVDPRQLSSLAPSLYVDQGAGNGQTHVGIRGLSSIDYSIGASSPVAIYIDDVYQPFSYGISAQIYDLNRVEVLRGPQGTLFGKNTVGGALLYYSQEATGSEGGYFTLDGGGGAQRHVAAEGAFNGPLSDTLAIRASFRADRRGNYVDDLLHGTGLGHSTSVNGRVNLVWRPSGETTVSLKAYALTSDGEPPIGTSRYYGNPCETSVAPYYRCTADGTPTPQSPNRTSVYESVPVFERFHNYGAVLKLDQKIGDYTLTSITAAQRGAYSSETGDSANAGDYFHTIQSSKTYQASQEVRFATPAAKPLHAVIGLFAMYDHINDTTGSGSTLIDPTFDYVSVGKGVQGTTTLAAFGNATYEFNRIFSIVGGLRYSSERKTIQDRFAGLNGFNAVDFSARDLTDADLNYNNALSHYPSSTTGDAYNDVLEANNDKHTWRRLTYDITANAKLSHDILIYAKYATGFRSGGYQIARSYAGTFSRLSPEKVASYEVGFKSELFDRRLRINASAYTLTYKDQVVQVTVPVGFGTLLQNAGKSRSKGVDLEITAIPVRNLTLSGLVGYNHARYQRYFDPVLDVNLAGNHLPTSPDWTASWGGSYMIPIGNYDLILANDWNYRSTIYYTPYNDPATGDRARTTGNAKITLTSRTGGWSLGAYVNNVTDTLSKGLAFPVAFTPFRGIFTPGVIGYVNTTYVPGRTWGLQGTVKF